MELIKTTLIDDELLKTYSPIPLEFDIQQKLYPFILSAQSDMKKVIGDALFSELIEQIESGNITTANKALLIEIAPAMASLSIYYALPSLWLSITQKGVTKEQSENSTSALKGDLNYYRVNIKTQCDNHTADLIEFLEKCKDNYPLYVTPCKKSRVGDMIHLKSLYKKNKNNNCNCGG